MSTLHKITHYVNLKYIIRGFLHPIKDHIIIIDISKIKLKNHSRLNYSSKN